MVKNFMVCVDGSNNSETALDECLKYKSEEDTILLAHAVELKATVFTAYSPPVIFKEVNEELTNSAKRLVHHYQKKLKDKGVSNVHGIVIQTMDKPPKEATVKIAEDRGIDTIFVGTRGLGAMKRFFLGSFANYLINHCGCNVMVVHHHEDKEPCKEGEIAAEARQQPATAETTATA